jgi:indolepyruvate ferredoxin oxidoreductase beta subunit
METNIILCGVGGQGILSISLVIDMTALKQGLSFKQAEVHGMSQRGGSVQSHLRVSDQPLWSDLVPRGRGTLILSIEPLESLRYVELLGPEGAVVTGVEPYVNVAGYPEAEKLLEAVASLPHHVLVPAERLARAAGSARAANMVLLGAAVPYLGLRVELCEASISEAFARKGEKVQRVNLDAFRAGRAAGEAYGLCRGAGIGGRETRALCGRLAGGVLTAEAAPLWRELFAGPLRAPLVELMLGKEPGQIAGDPGSPRAILGAAAPASERLRELLFATRA